MRRGLSCVTVLAAALVLAGCSGGGSPGPPGSTTTTTHHANGQTATSTTAPSATGTTQPPLQTLPTSGPLQAGTPVAIPMGPSQVAATEGPDGAIFVAPESPMSAAPSVVWVVDGNGPPAVAEHVSSGVAALAADASTLYVATYASVTAYDRSSGNQVGAWTLPPINTANASNADLVAMAAAGGHVLVSITQGNTVSVYRITPGTTAAPHLVAQGTDAVFGPDGSVYYERSDGHVVKLSPSGATTVGPALADKPTRGGGGVQFLDAVAGSVLWVTEPVGQGLDTQFSRYDTTSLRLLGSSAGTTTEQIVDTVAGPLVLSLPDSSVSCSSGSATPVSCLSRVTATGALTDALAVGSAFIALGPDPAVLAGNDTNTQIVLERIT